MQVGDMVSWTRGQDQFLLCVPQLSAAQRRDLRPLHPPGELDDTLTGARPPPLPPDVTADADPAVVVPEAAARTMAPSRPPPTSRVVLGVRRTWQCPIDIMSRNDCLVKQ